MTKGRSQTGLLLRAAVTLIAVLATCGCVVPDQKACLESFDGTEFATDDDVIGCVSKASPLCCDAIDGYLGLQSPFANCSCSAEVMTKVIEDSIPRFAVDLVNKRIEECGTVPLPGSSVCAEAGAAVHAFSGESGGGCQDIPPPYSDFTCAEQVGWGKCGEDFMAGFCNKSCGRCPHDLPQAASAEGV